jgi:hypothetical protein
MDVNASLHYRSTIVPVSSLDGQEIADMARLYLDHYDGGSEALFRRDLLEKSEVHLVFAVQENGEELIGFSSFLHYRADWQGRTIRVVYSGDTIIHPQHWRQQNLAFESIAYLGKLQRQRPDMPLYWFLLVKGHRTYKYMPVFCKRFFPNRAEPENADLKALADHLAGARFGTDYDPRAGIVRFPVSHGHLKPTLAEISERERNKPDTRFFLERNPGYRLGHELVCLCELKEENLRSLAARIFRGKAGTS